MLVSEKVGLPQTQPLQPSQPRQQDISARRRRYKALSIVSLILFALWLYHANCSPFIMDSKSDLPPSYEQHLNTGGQGHQGGSNPLNSASRQRHLNTGSQGLHGTFDLLDSLSIDSTSGKVSIGVHPQAADKENPLPAELRIHAQSGQVSIALPALNAPERDYQVSIESQSGSINGNILHGQSTSIVSQSGRIDMLLTPVAIPFTSTLTTQTQSASQKITVLGPSSVGQSIKEMKSSHSAASGRLELNYPREWEGTIEGYTSSGKMDLYGPGLEIVHQEAHHVLAKKGNGNSTLSFRTDSGSVRVSFG